ncbi:phage tail tape measure protein [Rahnella aquatilis]|nr:phage tail tape measure protein [Rahnella aquatilis]
MANLSIKVALGAIDKLSQPLNAARNASKGLATSIKSTQDNIRNLERSAKSFDRLSHQAKGTAEALKVAKEQSAKLRQEFGAASQRSDAQKKALSEQSKAIAGLRAQQKAEIANLKTLHQGMKDLGVTVLAGGRATEQITRKTQEYNQQLATQEERLKRTNAAQKSYDKTKELQKKVAVAGVKTSAVGGAMLWGSGRFISPGIEFNAQVSRTLAAARLTRGDKEAAVLEAQAKLLGRTTHYSATQASEGQAALINGGMTAQNAQKALPGVLNMALAAHADLGQAADVGSSILDSFQIDPSKMDHVGDVLVGTFTRSKTSLESLGETVKYVGSIAHGVGMSLEDVAAATAIFAKNGKEGSMAGTQMAEVIQGIYNPSTTGQKALSELNIKTKDSSGRLRRLDEVLKEYQQKSIAYDQPSQLAFASAIAGHAGAGGLQILAKSAGDGQLQEFTKIITQGNGEATKNAKEMTDNLAGDLMMLRSAWQGLNTEMESGVDNPMRLVIQDLTSIIQKVTEWTNLHPKLSAAILKILMGLGAVLLIIGSIIAAVAGILGPLALVKLSFKMLTGEVATASGAMTVLGRIATASMEAVGSLFAVITSPITLTLAAIAAISAGIVYYWEPIQRWFHNLTDKLAECAQKGNALKAAFAQFALDVMEPFRELYNFIDGLLSKTMALLGATRDAKALAEDAKTKKDVASMAGGGLGGMMGNALTNAVMPTQKASLNVATALNQAGAEFGKKSWDPNTKKDTASSTSSVTNTGRLGDIVFKNLPSYIPISGGYAEPRVTLAPRGGMASLFNSEKPVPAGAATGTTVAGDLHVEINIHDAAQMNPQQLAAEVKRQLNEITRAHGRQSRSRMTDKD